MWRDALRRVLNIWDDTEVVPPLFICTGFALSPFLNAVRGESGGGIGQEGFLGSVERRCAVN